MYLWSYRDLLFITINPSRSTNIEKKQLWATGLNTAESEGWLGGRAKIQLLSHYLMVVHFTIQSTRLNEVIGFSDYLQL